MKATELIGVREVVVKTLPEPEPAPGEIRVEVRSVAICGSDIAAYRGEHPRMVPPLILGHEFAGEVVAVGSGVSTELVGTSVAVDPLVTCGTCSACRAGRRNVCQSYRVVGCRPELPGAFAEFVVVGARQAWPLPEESSSVIGALIQPLAVSHHAVTHRGRVEIGDDVMIIGAGPIGLGAVMVAKTSGVSVTVVDVDRNRLDAALRLGADQVAFPDDATESEPSVVLDCAGGNQDESLAGAVRRCRPGGRVVVVGNFARGVAGPDPVTIKAKELDVLGSQAYDQSFGEVLDLVRDHRLDPLALVSHRLPLDASAKGLELLDTNAEATIKVVMTAEQSGSLA